MRNPIYLSFFLSLCFMAGCSDSDNYSKTLTEASIAPAYNKFHYALSQFNKDIQSACSESQDLPENELENIKNGWIDAMGAWQRVQWVHFGPVESDNNRWSFQFWPDKHNNVRKKTLKLLKNETLNKEVFVSSGVVTESFSAMEYVLFDPDFQVHVKKVPSGNICRYFNLASKNMLDKVGLILKSWQPRGDYYQSFVYPSENNPEYADQKSVETVVLDSLVAQLEIIKSDKLAGPLGEKSEKQSSNPYLLEAWRSRTSYQWIKLNLESIRPALDSKEFGILHRIEDVKTRQALLTELDDIYTKLTLLDSNHSGVMFESVALETNIYMHYLEQVTRLLKMVKNTLPAELGITLGFNANDGD